jgi:serralysin
MFTNFIQRAYADGTEFVTGADLAQRIQSFVATDIKISQEGGKIIATVTGSDVGKFALDVETNQVIASVDNWYAFDGAKVFLPKNGGTFAITLGSQAEDVTRIAELPMRAELVSATGNGTDLDFALNGRGDAKVDLKAWGANSVIATGADSGTLSGEVLKLSFTNLGSHSVTIDYLASQTVTGTASNDVIIGGLGNNQLLGDGGSDTFVYSVGGGIDTVLDFTPTLDKIQLIGSGFASVQEALAQFFQDAGGLTLSLSDNDRLVLANTTQIGEEHILLT